LTVKPFTKSLKRQQSHWEMRKLPWGGRIHQFRPRYARRKKRVERIKWKRKSKL